MSHDTLKHAATEVLAQHAPQYPESLECKSSYENADGSTTQPHVQPYGGAVHEEFQQASNRPARVTALLLSRKEFGQCTQSDAAANEQLSTVSPELPFTETD